jgi:hypothetical protein
VPNDFKAFKLLSPRAIRWLVQMLYRNSSLAIVDRKHLHPLRYSLYITMQQTICPELYISCVCEADFNTNRDLKNDHYTCRNSILR